MLTKEMFGTLAANRSVSLSYIIARLQILFLFIELSTASDPSAQLMAVENRCNQIKVGSGICTVRKFSAFHFIHNNK